MSNLPALRLSCGGDKTLVLSRVTQPPRTAQAAKAQADAETGGGAEVEAPTIRRYKSVAVPYGTIYGMDVDSTNKHIITAGQDKRLNIWSSVSGKHLRSYKPEPDGGELYKVQLDPSGLYAATCSFDKYIRLFDFYSGECIAKVSGHSELVTGVRFSRCPILLL